jgi:hypothetical protein
MTAKVRLGLIANTDLPEQSTHVRVLPQHLDSSSTPLVSDSAGIEPSGLVKNPSLTVTVAGPARRRARPGWTVRCPAQWWAVADRAAAPRVRGAEARSRGGDGAAADLAERLGVRRRCPFAYLEALRAAHCVSVSRFAALAGIPERTYWRRPTVFRADRRSWARLRKRVFRDPPRQRNRVWQMDFFEFETARVADLRSHRLRHQVLPRRHRHPDVSRPGCARLPLPGRCRGRTGPRPRRPPCRPRRDGRRRRRRLRDR